jgi:peptidoglycan/xylan/chitin deacetylase (PgdA/CDA1 family)
MNNLPQKAIANLAWAFPDAVFYKATQAPWVALTIDDVPIPGESAPCSTRWILDAIAEHNQSLSDPTENVCATFFIIGNHLNRDYDLLPIWWPRGMNWPIMVWSIPGPRCSPGWPLKQHFHHTHDRLIEQVPDSPIRWYRPGRAFYTPYMHEVIRQAPGYEPYFALASMLPLDTITATADPKFTARYVAQHVFPGAILLLHGGSVERSKNTAQALRLILPKLRSQGYRVTTLSDLWHTVEE